MEQEKVVGKSDVITDADNIIVIKEPSSENCALEISKERLVVDG